MLPAVEGKINLLMHLGNIKVGKFCGDMTPLAGLKIQGKGW